MKYILRFPMCGCKNALKNRKKPSSIGEHLYVEINGLKWALTNIGANKETDDGLYFAWGETEGYSRRGKDQSRYAASSSTSNNWSNYKFYDSETLTLTKYNSTDRKTVLDLEDDAAHIIWGGKWRMPTNAEVLALLSKSKWTTNYNDTGKNGFLYSDEKGNMLFFPASTNTINPGSNYYNKQGCYWTSTKASVNSNNAKHLHIASNNNNRMIDSGAYGGFTIRPVWDDSIVTDEDEYNGHEYIDLGLPSGTLWATRNVGSLRETAYGNYYMYGAGINKYDTSKRPYSGTDDPLPISYDTAFLLWGGEWHTPTEDLFTELFNSPEYVTYTWTTKTEYSTSPVSGYEFTSLVNGNSIFLPAGGIYYNGERLDAGTIASYWTSTPDSTSNAIAFGSFEDTLEGGGTITTCSALSKTWGLLIRPVIDGGGDTPSQTLANGKYKYDLTGGNGMQFACMEVNNGNVKVYAASTDAGNNINVYGNTGTFTAANGGESVLTAISAIAETYDNFGTIEKMVKASGNLSDWSEFVEITAAE